MPEQVGPAGSSGGGGGVSSVTGTPPIASSGGATPDITLADTAVTPGAYTVANITVDQKGRITAAANGSALVSGGALGTPSSGTLTNCTGLPVSTGISGLGTGIATALAVNVGSAGAPVVLGGALGTPSSGVLTNCTGLPVSSGVSGLGTGVATALGVNVGSAGAPVVNGGALGTPSSGSLASCTGLPVSTGISGFGTGVATALAVNVGSAGAPVINGGALGTPSGGTLTSCTGLPIGTGVSGLGTGVATALAVNVGTAGAPVVNGGALGTPSSGTLTNCTGLPQSGVSGLATTRQRSMLGPNAVPDSSGNCWQEPYSILATNDVWPFLIWRFGASNAAAPTTRIGLYGQFTVPQDYVGTCKIIPVWTATITSGDVAWDFDYRTVGGDDTTSLDQAGTEESVTVTDTAPGAANRRLVPQLSPTSANFAAGETVEFGIFRDGADAADTMAGSAMLVDLIFQYNTV